MKNYFDTLTKNYEDIITEINNEFKNMFDEKFKNENSTLKPFFLFNREIINTFSKYKSSYNFKFEVTNNENETTLTNLANGKGFQLNKMSFSYFLSDSELTTEIKTIGFINKIPKKNINIEFLFSRESSTISIIKTNNEYSYLSFNNLSDSVYLYPSVINIEPNYFNMIKYISTIDIDKAMSFAFEKENLSREEKEYFYLVHDIKIESIDYNLLFDINNIKKPLTTKQILNKNKRK